MPPSPGPRRCPDCGAVLAHDYAVGALCPQCLVGLALAIHAPPTEAPPTATLDVPASGALLGERYQVRGLLGRGGMGQVLHAFDLKLRVDVALKSVRPDRAVDERARDRLRQEVRAARQVVSPNVCRIFDLVIEDGREFVSMEYIEGDTLTEVLRRRGPLTFNEAREIGAQLLAGLEAIHSVGLAHCDFKPENVMITSAGRVVVMDFGLTGAWTDRRTGRIEGTPAYMAPEQARGEGVDARADVFAAGIVLLEMLTVGGASARAQRQGLWDAVRESPPRLPDSSWAPVLHQALAAEPADRYRSAGALARALEELAHPRPGADEQRPYPGLSPFTSADAQYFFGREADVEALLKRLDHPRLLAIVGPSGAGKSSFLRAGVLPHLPPRWRAVVATPGPRPFQSLAHALAAEVVGDAHAVQQLLRFDDADAVVAVFRAFRERHGHALVVLDQFEELFTLSDPAAQSAFAALLGRLVLDADCHVLLSLRDDFLLRCSAHEALTPAFSDLTPLSALGPSALRRALVQPALACGYQFEDESLVDEMVAAVSGERGALPLLAFAAARLWDERDRQRGVLTRLAYQDIGGVGGALARHAEDTLTRIGRSSETTVRTLFRHLVTPAGTREVRRRDELLAAFPLEATDHTSTRAHASEVTDALIGARLLTVYEEPAGPPGQQQIEIVHESLLHAWPRLVRWRTQDADGAELRQQLRHAATVWNDRGRSDDLLWSGTAFRDFAVWRERYTSELAGTDAAFAEATVRYNGRQRRRRQLAVTAVLAIALSVAAGAVALYRNADRARVQAEAASVLAEAGRVLVLGERDLDRHPTGALAFALKSLELADTPAGRLLALRALQQGPVARIAPVGLNEAVIRAFSPDGEWLALSGFDRVTLLNRNGGQLRTLIQYPTRGVRLVGIRFLSPDVLVSNLRGDLRLWSIPEGRERSRGRFEANASHLTDAGVLIEHTLDADGRRLRMGIRPYEQTTGDPPTMVTVATPDTDATQGEWFVSVQGRRLFLRPLTDLGGPPTKVIRLPWDVSDVVLSGDGSRLAVFDTSGRVGIWATQGPTVKLERELETLPDPAIMLDRSGQHVAAAGMVDGRPTVQIFDLSAPAGTEPIVISRGDSLAHLNTPLFDPSGQWVSTSSGVETEMWWIGRSHPLRFVFPDDDASSLDFTPDGRWLLAAFTSGVRALPLSSGDTTRIVAPVFSNWGNVVAVDPTGRWAAVGLNEGRLLLVDLQSGERRTLTGFSERTAIGALAFREDGRQLAAAPGVGPQSEKVVHIFDLETGSVQVVGPLPGAGEGQPGSVRSLRFVDARRLLAFVEGTGVVDVDLQEGTSQVVNTQAPVGMAWSADGRSSVGLRRSAAGNVTALAFRGENAPVPFGGDEGAQVVAIDRSGTLVASGSRDGIVRVGSLDGGEPHLLTGAGGAIRSLAFSRDARWIAAGSSDRSVRIWRVPDVHRTPLQALPHDVLLSMLRLQTNLRAVRVDGSADGYELRPEAFTGWASAPPE